MWQYNTRSSNSQSENDFGCKSKDSKTELAGDVTLTYDGID